MRHRGVSRSTCLAAANSSASSSASALSASMRGFLGAYGSGGARPCGSAAAARRARRSRPPGAADADPAGRIERPRQLLERLRQQLGQPGRRIDRLAGAERPIQRRTIFVVGRVHDRSAFHISHDRRRRRASGSTACSRRHRRPLALAPESPDPGWRGDDRQNARSAIPATASTPGTRSRVTSRRMRRQSRSPRISRSISCYEDDALIVIDKPKGLVVHPAAGNPSGTLVNALIAHCGASLSGIGGVKRPGIVHRLDKDTTGLMVVAKTDRRTAGAVGASSPTTAGPADSSGTISPSSGARRTARKARSTPRSTATPRRATSRPSGAGGREAITHWELLETYPGTDGKPVAEPARLPAGDRPDAPDPGASRPYRPSAAGRRRLRARLQDQGGASAGRRPRSARRPLADRPCTPIYWASNTPKPAKS